MTRIEPSYAEHILRVSTQHLRALLARTEALHEQDRVRLSTAVHNDLSQKLTAISIELALLQKKLSGDDAAKVNEILTLVGEASQSVRKLTNDLRPKILDEFGLVAAIKSECQRLAKINDVKFCFDSDVEDVALERGVAAELFRVFQEVVTNALRHSGASELTIEIKHDDSSVSVCVRDNGKGMNRETMNSIESFGLLNIHERMLRLGGKAELKSSRGKGTTVKLTLPLAKP